MKNTVFNAKPLGTGKLNVKKLEKVAGEVKEVAASYDLVVDFVAFSVAREKTGIDFARNESWQNVSSDALLMLCWCSLQRFHSDVSIEELRGMIGHPSQHYELWLFMLELCFPGSTERIEEYEEEQKRKKAAGETPGEASGEASSGETKGEALPAAETETPLIQNL